ncbi:murein L,D-transpeptidase [Lacibacter luteus]|uniref:Murein L,D-transpeptidase n=1 Tax=Lacibacter luteus TaxID=2508719 RepID=A0A4Q1CGH2_9BACT|nr:L,D-transpeptidase [Lacibacter luteus]RXK58865.1 murein L,D-transpeptidase [Lacibacter luteus]
MNTRTIHITGMLVVCAAAFFQCCQVTEKKEIPREKKHWNKPARLSYHLEKSKEWLAKKPAASERTIVLAVNRTDGINLTKMDSILVPDDLTGDRAMYLHFPAAVTSLNAVKKILFFSYPSQTFAAYEYGELVYAGPTNMGRKADTTPTGLYFCNWKAEETTSTFNDEWDLRWNFNIENKLGVGFHQYELPGYPASHSCLRLAEADAKHLYNWAEQWILDDDENLVAKGTPVIVFGSYPFDAAKPWLQLISNPHALDLTEAMLQQTAAPYLAAILKEQQTRAAVSSN